MKKAFQFFLMVAIATTVIFLSSCSKQENGYVCFDTTYYLLRPFPKTAPRFSCGTGEKLPEDKLVGMVEAYEPFHVHIHKTSSAPGICKHVHDEHNGGFVGGGNAIPNPALIPSHPIEDPTSSYTPINPGPVVVTPEENSSNEWFMDLLRILGLILLAGLILLFFWWLFNRISPRNNSVTHNVVSTDQPRRQSVEEINAMAALATALGNGGGGSLRQDSLHIVVNGVESPLVHIENVGQNAHSSGDISISFTGERNSYDDHRSSPGENK